MKKLSIFVILTMVLSMFFCNTSVALSAETSLISDNFESYAPGSLPTSSTSNFTSATKNTVDGLVKESTVIQDGTNKLLQMMCVKGGTELGIQANSKTYNYLSDRTVVEMDVKFINSLSTTTFRIDTRGGNNGRCLLYIKNKAINLTYMGKAENANTDFYNFRFEDNTLYNIKLVLTPPYNIALYVNNCLLTNELLFYNGSTYGSFTADKTDFIRIMPCATACTPYDPENPTTATKTYIDNFNVYGPDGMNLLSTTPAQNDTNASINTGINFNYNYPIDSASLANASVSVNGVQTGTLSLSDDSKTVNVSTDGALAEDTQYTVEVSGLRDVYNRTVAPAGLTFTTSSWNPEFVENPIDTQLTPNSFILQDDFEAYEEGPLPNTATNPLSPWAGVSTNALAVPDKEVTVISDETGNKVARFNYVEGGVQPDIRTSKKDFSGVVAYEMDLKFRDVKQFYMQLNLSWTDIFRNLYGKVETELLSNNTLYHVTAITDSSKAENNIKIFINGKLITETKTFGGTLSNISNAEFRFQQSSGTKFDPANPTENYAAIWLDNLKAYRPGDTGLVAVSPTYDAVEVATNSEINFTYNFPIKESSLATAVAKLNNHAVAANFYLSEDGKTVSVNLVNKCAVNTVNAVTLEGLADFFDRSVPSKTTKFTTASAHADWDISRPEYIETETDLTCSITVTNSKVENQKICFIVASYDSTGNLSDIDFISNAYCTQNTLVPLSATVTKSAGGSIKAMLWKSMNEMIPIGQYYER